MEVSSSQECGSLIESIPVGGGPDEGWDYEEHHSVDVWTKQENDGSLSVRCRSIQKQPMFNAISLIKEIDLHPSFMPHLAKATQLHSLPGCGKRTNLLLRYIYQLPLPFANRDTVMFAFGCNAIDVDGINGLIISAQSIPNGSSSWWGQPVPPEGADRTVRENVRGMSFIMKPVGEDQTEITVVANLDKHLAFIPKSLMNWLIKDMIKGLYKNMIKINAKFPRTEFAKRVQTDPDFYNWVKLTIDKHFNGVSG